MSITKQQINCSLDFASFASYEKKFEEKLTCGLENDTKILANFHQSTLKPQNWGPFTQSKKCMSLKFTKELCVMKIKIDVKFEDELICRFQIDMRSLINFDMSFQKFQIFAL